VRGIFLAEADWIRESLLGVGLFGGYGWGWHHWDKTGRQNSDHNHNTYIFKARTIINRNTQQRQLQSWQRVPRKQTGAEVGVPLGRRLLAFSQEHALGRSGLFQGGTVEAFFLRGVQNLEVRSHGGGIHVGVVGEIADLHLQAGSSVARITR